MQANQSKAIFGVDVQKISKQAVQDHHEQQSSQAPFNRNHIRYALEQQHEGPISKGCNCKKSKCMKMYCQCFLAGTRCTSNCKCLGCQNLHGPEQTIQANGSNCLQVNNNASSYLNSGQLLQQIFEIKRIKIQNRGCNCKKSGCQKKYCQCFNAGILCNNLCKCQQCKNLSNLQSLSQSLGANYNQNLIQLEGEGAPQKQKMVNISQEASKEQKKDMQIMQLFSSRLQTLTSSIELQYRQSMLQFIYYLLN